MSINLFDHSCSRNNHKVNNDDDMMTNFVIKFFLQYRKIITLGNFNIRNIISTCIDIWGVLDMDQEILDRNKINFPVNMEKMSRKEIHFSTLHSP